MKGYRLADNSTIWEDGSRTGGGFNDPPGNWAYPPAGGGTLVEIATETPAQSGGYGVRIVQAKPPVLETPPIYSPAPPVAQVNQPPTAPQNVAVGEPAPGTSPTPLPVIAVPTVDQALGSVGTWWSGLSNGTKIAVGALGAGALIAVLARGSATP